MMIITAIAIRAAYRSNQIDANKVMAIMGEVSIGALTHNCKELLKLETPFCYKESFSPL